MHSLSGLVLRKIVERTKNSCWGLQIRLRRGFAAEPNSTFQTALVRAERVAQPHNLVLWQSLTGGATHGRKWFWVLLPKQKDLGCRAETRL